ncbi:MULTISPECIES: Lsr2 family protein [Saccharopolyspora]|uniref:Lsr2 family protein n=1 Tax=Saccharopolyspora gregorii TaxID=33914 RepID=A0ABP6RRR3_9PSEU|nr:MULTISPECIES: Lsr2 family protein [Saccharopolyspora]MCA1186994.1 Lsr2 family protein [Saccharopolyspora sp. 6T]MCA1195366.1 Lsr2 family protein [Saccharopolyspora sp. 6V]MCA1228600.1 Lsr2 family protein [Saccharopolyspora sp. 6M]MCA1283552.1 Lsr2 family protein [Saccharopolyspora sp. 7B]
MAERIQVELVDDIDGSPAQQTVTFALDGVTYEIDLSERHAQRLRGVFARYIERARVPEREQSAATAKRQERDERDARQANRQLTEQIRGAAQRSKDRLHKQQEPEADEQAAEAGPALPVEPREPEQLVPEPPRQEEERSNSTVASVSLPQFSSAVD